MTEEEVVSIARAEAERQGWPWIEPVLVQSVGSSGSSQWRVMTNTRYMGGNVSIVVDDRTGRVVSKGFARR